MESFLNKNGSRRSLNDIGDSSNREEIFAFFLSMVAGIGATSLGAAMVFCLPKNSKEIFCKAIALSAGVFLYVALGELLPVSSGYFIRASETKPNLLGWESACTGASVIVGIVISEVLNWFVNYVWPEGKDDECENESSSQTASTQSSSLDVKPEIENSFRVTVDPPIEDSVSYPHPSTPIRYSTSRLAPPLVQNIDLQASKAMRTDLAKGNEQPDAMLFQNENVRCRGTQTAHHYYFSPTREPHAEGVNEELQKPKRLRTNSRDMIQPLTPQSYESYSMADPYSHVELTDHATQFVSEGIENTSKIQGFETIHHQHSSHRHPRPKESDATIEPRESRMWLGPIASVFTLKPQSSVSEIDGIERRKSMKSSEFSTESSIVKATNESQEAIEYKSKTFKEGIISCILLGIHNVPEGIATFSSSMESTSFGLSIAIAIALHNVPEGVVVASKIYMGTGNKWQAFFWGAVPGVAEPIGALIGWAILAGTNADSDSSAISFGVLYGAVCGIVVHILIKQLIPVVGTVDPEDKYGTSWILLGFCFTISIMALVAKLG